MKEDKESQKLGGGWEVGVGGGFGVVEGSKEKKTGIRRPDN